MNFESYDDSLTLDQARDRYFATSGIGREYNTPWVRLDFFGMYIKFPNTIGRIRAAKLHDLHHIATGYQTTWTGEAEIGAWELARGCKNYRWAWLLNFYGFTIGLFIAPAKVYRAFCAGDKCENLYYLESAGFHDDLLKETVGQLRQRLLLHHPPYQPSSSAIFKFFILSILALLNLLAPVILCFLIW